MNTSISTNYNNLSHLFGQKNFSSISFVNNSSNISTMMSGTESLLMNSIRRNNKIRIFQKKNKKLKNEIKCLKRINIERFSFRNLILQKSLYNMVNNTIKTKLTHKNKLFFDDYYDKKKEEIKKIDLKTPLSDRIVEQIYNNKLRNISDFSNRMRKIILLKKYIYDQKQNYNQKLIEKDRDQRLLISINMKMKRISFIIKELDNILTLFSYVKYLDEIKNHIKYSLVQDSTTMDYLKNDIFELLIKIKAKADKLADLINIRNLLVCIKEGIFMKNLPLNFTFYIFNYQDTLDKIFKIANTSYFMREEKEKEINNLIPTNLLQSLYSKNISKMKDLKSNKEYSRLKNYLKINAQIFHSREEFQKCFDQMQNKINDKFIYILKQNKNDFDPELDFNLVKDKNLNILKNKQIIEQKQKEFDVLKEENTFLNIYLQKIKNENSNTNDYIIKSQKNDLRSLNKLLLDSINNETISLNLKFLYNFNQLQNEKKYEIKGAYIYHTIMTNILQLYKIRPKYITHQINFQMDEFRFRIKSFNNCVKSSYQIILNEVCYLMRIYESAITYFFVDLNKEKNRLNSIRLFNKISNNIFIKRRKESLRFKFGLEDKLYIAKLDKVIQKQNKFIIKHQNIYFPDINAVKLRKNKSEIQLFERNKDNKDNKNNNKDNTSINNVNFDYSSMYY